MIVLAYLGPLALIPLLMEKEDQEVQWHAKHGLVLTVAEVAVFIAVVFAITGAISSVFRAWDVIEKGSRVRNST